MSCSAKGAWFMQMPQKQLSAYSENTDIYVDA